MVRRKWTPQAGFNPLPPPKRGETWARFEVDDVPAQVSIHSPRRSEGRLGEEETTYWLVQFQSTPPAEARGDLAEHPGDDRLSGFQSTPPAEARGDLI